MRFMELAIEEAVAAKVAGEVPVGALIVHRDGEIISRAHNLTKSTYDPSAHAEINALRIATEKVKNNVLTDFDLFVTLEPCLYGRNFKRSHTEDLLWRLCKPSE